MDYDDDSQEILLDRLIDSNQFDRATDILNELLINDPENSYRHAQLGLCHWALDRNKEAKQEYQIAIKLDPEFGYALYMLAYIYFYTSIKNSKALSFIQQALAIDSNDADYWVLYGRINNQIDQHAEANQCAQRALKIDPEHFEARLLKVEIMADPTNPVEANPRELIKHYEKLLERDPENIEVITNIAEVHHKKLNQYDQAITLYEKALRINPENAEAKKGIVHATGCKSLLYRLLCFPRYLNVKFIRIFNFIIYPIYFITTWPIIAAYRYLTLAETRKRLGQLHLYRGFTAKIHKSPFILRMSFFTLLWIAFGYFWYLVFAESSSPRHIITFIIAGFIILFRLLGLCVILYWPISKVIQFMRKRKANKLLSQGDD